MINKVAIFGGGGFIARYTVPLLGRRGIRLRLASRGGDAAASLVTQGDVGQIVPTYADVTDAAAVARAVVGCDGVINLAGVLNPPANEDFYAVHSVGARNIAFAAAHAGVKSLVHVSALGVDKRVRSHYAASKLQGEQRVREQFPKAVILRPTVVFGLEDRFINNLARLATYSPFLPLIGGGLKLTAKPRRLEWDNRGWRLQPLYVEDLARAIVKALLNDKYQGRVLNLGGGKVYSFAQLWRLIFAATGRSGVLVPMPIWALRAFAYAVGWLPYAPITPSQANMLKFDNVVAPAADGFKVLGLKANGDLAQLAEKRLLNRFKSPTFGRVAD